VLPASLNEISRQQRRRFASFSLRRRTDSKQEDE
jgi:hypothetical protein